MAVTLGRPRGLRSKKGFTPRPFRSKTALPWLEYGAVAQSIERFVRNEEVRGLIPLSSTSLRQGFGWQAS